MVQGLGTIGLQRVSYSRARHLLPDLGDWGQAVTHCGLGRYQSARAYLCATLKFAVQMDSIAYMILSLPSATLMLWNEGQRELAVEMLALAFSHPKSEQRWFVKSPLGDHALEQMKKVMGEDEFNEVWQRGTQRDLHETSAALLTLFPASK